MADTRIEWADKVWNPISGCTPISESCTNCYARRMAKRLAGRYGYPADDPFRVTFHPDRLREPRGWKKPQRIFVVSMGDLFHDDIRCAWIDSVRNVILEAYWHTFIILTKRIENAVQYFTTLDVKFPNIWFGVSVENQKLYDKRIPELLKLQKYFPVLFVSIEPILDSVDITEGLKWYCLGCGEEKMGAICECGDHAHGRLDWVILGCENGPGRRPFQMDWARMVRDQCVAAGVPFFFKQAPNVRGQVIDMPFLDGLVWNQFPVNKEYRMRHNLKRSQNETTT